MCFSSKGVRMEANQHFLSFKSSIALVVFLSFFTAFLNQGLTAPLLPSGSPPDSVYTELFYSSLEHIPSSAWTKSVLFNSTGTKLYTFNLEEMSISEFDSSTKTLSRQFSFKPTAGSGWNYQQNKPMPSFEEKPVEGCFSHHDRILWVSLHNAGGIVAIPMDSMIRAGEAGNAYPTKTVFAYNVEKKSTDTLQVPFIKTGKTPKVIAVTADNQSLLVSNWHSNSVSVISINDSIPPYGTKLRDIRTGILPRGIAITDGPKIYVTNMGSNLISVINNKTWKVERSIHTGYNARHIIASEGRLYVSYNTTSLITCFSNSNNQLLFKSATSANPRTIALSKNQQFLFVTCYEGNSIDVFKINKGSFTLIYSIKCSGKPIGIDLREDTEKLEAWVCTYTGKSLQVFSFEKR